MKCLSPPKRVAGSLLEQCKARNGERRLTEKEMRLLAQYKESAGRTELLKLDLSIPNKNRIYAKCEFQNPTGSHYDRVYPNLIEILLRTNYTPDRFDLVETSSGNATPAFTRLCKELGYNVWAVLPRPEELSKKRINMSSSAGAKVIHADPQLDGYGLPGVAKRMLRLIRESRNWQKPIWSPNHSIVAETVEAIFPVTAETMTGLDTVDYYIGVAGNGTTLYGIGAPLKSLIPRMKVIAIEPHSNPGMFLLKYPHMKEHYECTGELPQLDPTPELNEPKDYIITMPGSGCYGLAEYFPHIIASIDLVDGIRQIDDKNREWEKPIRKEKTANDLLFEAHGIRVGITSAASLMVAFEIASKVYDKNIVIVFYDLVKGRY